MEEVIRIIDVSVYNETHYGLVFRKNANIKKYLKDKGYELWQYYKSADYDYDDDDYRKLFVSETKLNESSGRINILEHNDMYGDTKSRIIYDEDIENVMETIRKNMKLHPSGLEEGKFCDVELYEKTCNLLDGSTVHVIGFKKVTDIDGEELFICDHVCLIKNVPVIDYQSSGEFKANFTTKLDFNRDSKIQPDDYYLGECCNIIEEIFDEEGIDLFEIDAGGGGGQGGGYTFIAYEYYENGDKKDFGIMVTHDGLDIEISVNYDQDSNIFSKVVEKLTEMYLM
jgi:hypothetical protein